MAAKYQSKSSRQARLAQNKGVKHGTRRVGAGGRVVRSWNAKTARWDRVGPASRSGIHGQVSVAGAGSDGVNARTSAGPAWSSNNQTRTGAATFGGRSVTNTKKIYRPAYKPRPKSIWQTDPLAKAARFAWNELNWARKR